MPCITKAATHAITHCHTASPTAHLPPSSRRTEATAATHGVYSRLNTSREAAASGERMLPMAPPSSTSSVETTLSLAMKPLMSAVQMRQSPSPSGANSGTSTPAAMARMLSDWSDTMFRCRSKR